MSLFFPNIILEGAQNIALCCLVSSLNKSRKNAEIFAHWNIVKILLFMICQVNAGKMWIKDSHPSLASGLNIQSKSNRQLNKHIKENKLSIFYSGLSMNVDS